MMAKNYGSGDMYIASRHHQLETRSSFLFSGDQERRMENGDNTLTNYMS